MAVGAAGVSGVGGASSGAPAGVVSAIEAVDGAGAEPKFGMEDFGIDGAGNPLEAKGKAKVRKNKDGTPPTAGADGQLQTPGGLETETSSWDTEAASFFERELGGEQPTKAEVDDEDGAEDVEVEGEGAEKSDRYQKLIERRKAAETRAKELESVVGESQQAVQQLRQEAGQAIGQLQNQLQSTLRQNAAMQAKLEMLMSGQVQQRPEDDITRARRELMSEAEKTVFDKHVSPLQKELNGLKQFIQQDRQKQRTAHKSQEYRAVAEKASVKIGMQGLPEAVAAELLPSFQEEVLGVMWGKRTDADNAAKIVRNRHLRFGLEFVKAQAKANRDQIEKTKDVPSRVPASKAVGAKGGDGLPPWEIVQANGYKSFHAWELDGKPPLKWPGT